MALVKVGSKYRVVYESKNLVSGIDNIFAIIKRPDGIKVGPVQLSEEIIPELLGTYSVEISIASNDPLGEWTGVVLSMDEAIKSGFRFSVTDLAGSSIESSCEEEIDLHISEEDIDLNIDKSNITLTVKELKQSDLIIDTSSANLKINEDFTLLNVQDENIKLEIECEE